MTSAESNRGNASDFIGECYVSQSCEPCLKTGTSKAARLFCKDCQEFLCETCRNPHIAYKSGQHGMVIIQESEPSHVALDMKGMDICNDHGKAFEFFCEDHFKLCCTICVITHRRCDELDEISTISSRKLAELDTLKQCLLKLEADTDAYVIECKQSEKQLTESFRDISKEVEYLGDRCIKQIEEAKRSFMTKANALKNEEVNRLNDKHAANTKVKDEINDILSMFSAISKQGTFQQKCIFSKQIEEKYKTIVSDINEQRTMHVSKKVTLSYPKELSSFLEMGENIVKVKLERTDAANGLCCKLEVPCPEIRPMVQFRELEVERNAVKLIKKLGNGQFGDVWAGKWRNTVDVAVKTLLMPGLLTPEAFLEEAKLMHLLRHQKIVQLIAVRTTTEPIWIIRELLVNGALKDYLRKDEGRTITFNIIADMAGQIAEGMVYLGSENCVHRDLRAHNILVGEHHEVKIADFSFARIIQEDIYIAPDNDRCALKWTAPEAAFDNKFSIKSDVWSYGVLLYELITFGRDPYPGMKGRDVIFRVDKGFRMPRPTGGPVACPEPYYEHMLKCWKQWPEARPTFAYLQDFFNNFMVSTEGKYKPID